MKKLTVLFVCAAMLASCDSFKGGNKDLKAENDSLLMELTQRNAELDDMMGTFNEVQEGFRKINVWIYNAERSLRIQPVRNSRLLPTSSLYLNRWKRTKHRLPSCRLN